jgi:hypothetical protein
MRLNHRTIVAVAVCLLAASVASADKLKGYLWEVSPASIVVEGQAVSLGPETKIERQNQKDITAKDCASAGRSRSTRASTDRAGPPATSR